LIAFLVYAGLVKVDSEIENYWSVKTLYHGLWAIEIISRFRYKPLMAFLNMVDPVTEDYSNKLQSQFILSQIIQYIQPLNSGNHITIMNSCNVVSPPSRFAPKSFDIKVVRPPIH
jgi:hypothetical protein